MDKSIWKDTQSFSNVWTDFHFTTEKKISSHSLTVYECFLEYFDMMTCILISGKRAAEKCLLAC